MSQARQRQQRGKGSNREKSGTARVNVPPSSPVRSRDLEAKEATSVQTGADTMDLSSMLATWRRQPMWMVLAVSSGACAAFNGVFAKLTTTSLTSHLSSALATTLGLSPDNTFINLALRGTFFLLNLLFNALMWALFTGALTRAESTTRVSIINVSANFVITALLGWMIFGEQLKGMWWVGAAFLAAGNVVIGRREEEGSGKNTRAGGSGSLVDETREEEEAEALVRDGSFDGARRERGGASLVELDDFDGSESGAGGRREEQRRLHQAQEADDPI